MLDSQASQRVVALIIQIRTRSHQKVVIIVAQKRLVAIQTIQFAVTQTLGYNGEKLFVLIELLPKLQAKDQVGEGIVYLIAHGDPIVFVAIVDDGFVRCANGSYKCL